METTRSKQAGTNGKYKLQISTMSTFGLGEEMIAFLLNYNQYTTIEVSLNIMHRIAELKLELG